MGLKNEKKVIKRAINFDLDTKELLKHCIIISQMIYLYIRLKAIIFMFRGIIWIIKEAQELLKGRYI